MADGRIRCCGYQLIARRRTSRKGLRAERRGRRFRGKNRDWTAVTATNVPEWTIAEFLTRTRTSTIRRCGGADPARVEVSAQAAKLASLFRHRLAQRDVSRATRNSATVTARSSRLARGVMRRTLATQLRSRSRPMRLVSIGSAFAEARRVIRLRQTAVKDVTNGTKPHKVRIDRYCSRDDQHDPQARTSARRRSRKTAVIITRGVRRRGRFIRS